MVKRYTQLETESYWRMDWITSWQASQVVIPVVQRVLAGPRILTSLCPGGLAAAFFCQCTYIREELTSQNLIPVFVMKICLRTYQIWARTGNYVGLGWKKISILDDTSCMSSEFTNQGTFSLLTRVTWKMLRGTMMAEAFEMPRHESLISEMGLVSQHYWAMRLMINMVETYPHMTSQSVPNWCFTWAVHDHWDAPGVVTRDAVRHEGLDLLQSPKGEFSQWATTVMCTALHLMNGMNQTVACKPESFTSPAT